jgi:hypothetical protein
MPLFDIKDRRILIFPIPKPARSSLTKWLSSHSVVSFFRPRPELPLTIPSQHLRWRDFDYVLNNPQVDYEFAGVRNPFARP